MAYIAPNSRIEFFPDFGVDPGYENTMYFEHTSDKDRYFEGIVGMDYVEAQSYTRVGRGKIKVQKTMAQMYNKGYMRFKNTSFENKWFYAFITHVEYINNITTEVNFQIDVMMTWMGDFSLADCFIERQHSETDLIGENLVDEGLPCGDLFNEFVESSTLVSGVIGSWWICLTSTADPADGSDVPGDLYGGIYSGSGQWYYNTTSQQDMDDLANALAYLNSTKPSAIIGLAMVPGGHFQTVAGSYATEYTHVITKPYTSVAGYVPKNKKLFVYPYKSLQVTNMEGNFAEFRYEFFWDKAHPLNCYFEFFGVSGMQSEVSCSPMNYKSIKNGNGESAIKYNVTEKMSMSDFPMCTYSVDAYNAYLAQNKSSIAANVLSSVITTGARIGAGIATGGASELLTPLAGNIGTGAPQVSDAIGTGAIMSSASTLNSVIGVIGKLRDLDRMPPQRAGSQGVSALMGRGPNKQNKDFYFIGKSITPEFAEIIDGYFTMYGYAQMTVGTPDMDVRPHFTYVKTVGCIVKGAMPADDCRKIEEIFDKGVRFWKNHNEIGNYSVNNAPT